MILYDSFWKFVTSCDCVCQLVIVCYSVRQFVTVCDSLLQVVTACDTLWQLLKDCDNMWQFVTACFNLWQCATTCDLLWQLVIVCYSVCLKKVRQNEVEVLKLGEGPMTKIKDVWTLQEIHPCAKILWIHQYLNKLFTVTCQVIPDFKQNSRNYWKIHHPDFWLNSNILTQVSSRTLF